MYQSCLPSHYFYKTTKKQNKSGIQVSHLFFKQIKHMGEILKNNGEWVNCGWKPTNLFLDRGIPRGNRVSSGLLPIRSIHGLKFIIGDRIIRFDTPQCEIQRRGNLSGYTVIGFLIQKNPHTHTHPNEWIYGWKFHGSLVFTTQKRKKCEDFVCFFGKDMWYFLHRSTFFLTIILPTLPQKTAWNKFPAKISFCLQRFFP